jgi:hypothetical protein
MVSPKAADLVIFLEEGLANSCGDQRYLTGFRKTRGDKE